MALAKIISWVGHLNFWLLGEGAQTFLDVSLWCTCTFGAQGRADSAHISLSFAATWYTCLISELSTRVDYLRDSHWISAKWWSVGGSPTLRYFNCRNDSVGLQTNWCFSFNNEVSFNSENVIPLQLCWCFHQWSLAHSSQIYMFA